jgi:leucyl-tRNA synthetase
VTETTTTPKAKKLTVEQTAVLQLVTLAPSAPCTADELAKQYAGLRQANLWPEQTQKSVRERIDELVAAKVLKEGDTAPSGDPVIELVD